MTDTDYSFGSPEDSIRGQENRSDYRLTARAKATLEFESQIPDGTSDIGEADRHLECQIRDISVQGLCLLSPEQASVGALLPALVALDHYSEPFKLTVEVVWCQPDGPGFLVGVKILKSDETAYVEWVEAVASAMAVG